MWTRTEIKSKARTDFKANYWHTVIAGIIICIITAIGKSQTTSGGDSQDTSGSAVTINGMSIHDFVSSLTNLELAALAGTIVGVGSLIYLILVILIKNPLRVGYSGYLLSCRPEGGSNVKTMFTCLKGHYVEYGVAMFTTDIIEALWSLLLIIPGIYKAYQYRMVPYILVENPEFTGTQARERSKELMEGNKWAAFILDLSFIGWYILTVIPFVNAFWTYPYTTMAECELYRTLKGEPEPVVAEVVETVEDPAE